MKDLNVTEQVADSLITLSLGGQLDNAKEAHAIEAIDRAVKMWNDQFLRLLLESHHTTDSFQAVIITARVHEEFFTRNFREMYPKVYVASSFEQISNIVSFSPRTEVLLLTGLYAVAINSLSGKK